MKKRAWALWLARRYVARALSRRFEGLFVDGLEGVRAAAARGPLLLAANHVSWWDAFVVVALDQALGTESRVLMDQENLARLPFLGAIGALPLSLRDPRRARAQLQAAAQWLERPRRALWLFPQGVQTPSWRRPLGFHKSFARVASEAACPVVPVSLLFTWRDRPEPAIAVRMHEPISMGGTTRAFAHDVEGCVARGLDTLDVALSAGPPPPLLVRGTARGADLGIGARLLVRTATRGAP